LKHQRWNQKRLRAMAEEYGTKTTIELIGRCLQKADEP